MMQYINYIVLMIFITMFISCSNKQEPNPKVDMLKAKISQFSKTELKYDDSLLDEHQKIVVQKLFEAGQIIDEIYLDQVFSKNKSIRQELKALNTEEARLTLEYFDLMFGPFDRLNHEKPFYGPDNKPDGANFYPVNLTKKEFNNWIAAHPEDETSFTSEFTVIRRDAEKLVAIPYTEYYKEPLSKIIMLMQDAAEYADNPSLKKYLLTRATAFETNDYFESDMAWMDLKDHTIEVIIGPYEVYEDGLFGYKAAFESFLTLKDPAESKKLAVFGNYLDEMEKNLPIPDKYKNFSRGSESPIMVVQEVFSAGDTKAGVQTLAFNLPNDERVREAKGSKKVMIKNMHEAKFSKLLKPIAEVVLAEDQQKYVSFDGFFNHTLMHEISHGLGPGSIVLNGRKTTVSKELKDTYSKIEECKADVLGMYNNKFMIDKDFYPAEFVNEMYATFLAGIFRSIRFGINEAHGAGNAIIFNYILEKGGYTYDVQSNKVRVNFEQIDSAIKELANMLLTLQAEGDYAAAIKLIDTYAVESDPIATLRASLTDLPVDIYPLFQIAQ